MSVLCPSGVRCTVVFLSVMTSAGLTAHRTLAVSLSLALLVSILPILQTSSPSLPPLHPIFPHIHWRVWPNSTIFWRCELCSVRWAIEGNQEENRLNTGWAQRCIVLLTKRPLGIEPPLQSALWSEKGAELAFNYMYLHIIHKGVTKKCARINSDSVNVHKNLNFWWEMADKSCCCLRETHSYMTGFLICAGSLYELSNWRGVLCHHSRIISGCSSCTERCCRNFATEVSGLSSSDIT